MFRAKSRDGTRKVTPPSPTYMSNEQFAAYLANLRNSRTTRPVDGRVPGPTANPPNDRPSTEQPRLSHLQARHEPETNRVPLRQERPGPPAPTMSSARSRYSMEPQTKDRRLPDYPAPLKLGEAVPSAVYIERGQRWMEKEEAASLKHAINDMDNTSRPKDTPSTEEDRIYQAALNEAAELVWAHQNGGPQKPRDPNAPFRYREHLKRNSYAHARTASIGRASSEMQRTGLNGVFPSRSVSGSSTESADSSFPNQMHPLPMRLRDPAPESKADVEFSTPAIRYPDSGPAPRKYGSLPTRRRSSAKRNISGEPAVPFSGDQIWEEPEAATPKESKRSSVPDATPPALESRPPNPFSRVRFTPTIPDTKKHAVDIHRNPPSQSRNPQYTINGGKVASGMSHEKAEKPPIEIRSSDIREATSIRMNRSEKLPTPTGVSHNPSRPIVSFQKNWAPPDEPTISKDVQPDLPQIPQIRCDESPQRQSTSPVPIISIECQSDGPNPGAQPVPSITIQGTDNNGRNTPSIVVPSIVTPTSNSSKPTRPLPVPGATRHKPFARAPIQRPRNSLSASSTLCHECGMSIEGRFVALAGSEERFHPQCFSCYTCGTSLEALEISPEPRESRKQRLERIRLRASGEILEETPGQTMAEDGDERLRFYCHLDWHELFAPRCKHCKTPIIGEHIVALGSHWHFGHFFCAECGDPFEHGMTHIEKDGYAWCVKCQTKRTERRAPKCMNCKQAVIGQYVEALGGEWHDACFRCSTCGDGFDDGQIFVKEESGKSTVQCTGCRSRELKQ